MIQRRKEPFRYSMEHPLDCQIEITAIAQMSVSGRLAPVELQDISKNGCKVRSTLNLHADHHPIECVLHVVLSQERYAFPGRIRWQRQLAAPYYSYGIQLDLTEEEKETINQELRLLAAERKIKVM